MKTFFKQLLVISALSLPLVCLAEDEVEKKVVDKDWVIISAPASATFGEEVTAEVKIKGEAVKVASVLRADLHAFHGEDRKPQGKHSQPFDVAAGEDAETTVTFTVPEDVSHISFVLYLLPAGEELYEKRTHAAELSLKVNP